MEEADAEAAVTAAKVGEALKSFTCFLYVGKSYPYYKAKPWNDDDYYAQGERMRNLEILAGYKKTELVPIDKIKLAMDSELIRRPETLMFALAMCARQKKSEKLRAAAYYFLAEHCKQWKYFILFIKFASELCKLEVSKNEDTTNDEIKQPVGCGRGWKNTVNKWYFTKDVTELVEVVTKYKGDHGWTHKDLFKLAHPERSSLEVEKQAVLCYVMNGLTAAETEFGNDPEAKKTLLYIRNVEAFKKCHDKDSVVKGIAVNNWTIDYVHPMALKHKEVWQKLLEKMDVRTILKYLPKLNQWGSLTRAGPATPLIVGPLTDEHTLTWNKVLPPEILIVLNRYESAPTHKDSRAKKDLEAKAKDRESKGSKDAVVNGQKKNKSKGLRQSTRLARLIETKEPDMRIRDALRTALAITQTVDITRSSKKRYLISIKLPGRRRNTQCAEAGLALALPLLHRDKLPEDAVTIIGYLPGIGGKPIAITREMNFDDALELLHEPKQIGGTVFNMPFGALGWAYREKKSYDVFINISNEPPSKKCKDDVLQQFYIKEMKMPDIRVINVVIHRIPFKLPEYVWKNSLVINGFDPYVPWIIEAYVRGLF